MGIVSHFVTELKNSELIRQRTNMAWHKGEWLPLYCSQWYSPGVSQHPFDPYSFTHVLHGVVLFYLWHWLGLSHLGGFLAMFSVELTWELAENSERVIERYRQTSGTSEDYEGDSYQNILGDLAACQSGYILSLIFNAIGMAKLSFIWYVVTEIVLIFYMRDCLTLTMVTLFFPNKKVSKWQQEGVKIAREKEKNSNKKE